MELGVESVLVTEDALKDAFRFMYGRMKLACEVAGGATAAALLSGAFVPEPGRTVAAVVSGGNVAPETAAAILKSDEA
jgi:threonine dehydratase